MSKIVCGMLSFKMGDLTDETVMQLQDPMMGGFTLGEDFFVYENGDPTDTTNVAESVTDYTGSNLRMTGGFNYIVTDLLKKFPELEVLWLCTNDFDIIKHVYPVKRLLAKIGSDTANTIWHPSLEPISGYAYPWMFRQDTQGPRRVNMVDFIAPAFNRPMLDTLLYHQKTTFHHDNHFDPSFYRGWGIDYESCMVALQYDGQVMVDDCVSLRHVASKTYTSGTAPEDKDTFYSQAMAEMETVMVRKYGRNWRARLA